MQGELRTYRPKKYPGVSVEIRSPSERDKRRIFADVPPGDLDESTVQAERALRAHVVSVTGYTHRGRTPTTGAELVEWGDSLIMADLYLEIVAEVSLSEGESALSGGPSGSSAPESSTVTAGAVATAAPGAASVLAAVT